MMENVSNVQPSSSRDVCDERQAAGLSIILMADYCFVRSV